MTVASIVTPPGLSQGLAAVDLAMSYARGHEITAMDMAAVATPSLRLLKLGGKIGKSAKMLDAGVRTAQRVEAVVDAGVAVYEAREQIYNFGRTAATGDLRATWDAAIGLGGVAFQATVGLASARSLGGRFSPCQQKRIYIWSDNQSTCFVSGTPITLRGHLPIKMRGQMAIIIISTYTWSRREVVHVQLIAGVTYTLSRSPRGFPGGQYVHLVAQTYIYL